MSSLPAKLRGHAEQAQVLADNALNSFIIINAALQRSSALAEYTARGDVQKRMGEGYRVGMGFGLHTGCAAVAVHAVSAVRLCAVPRCSFEQGCCSGCCPAVVSVLLRPFSELRDNARCAARCRWSIEGAIGSRYKVDASYLSPNVNTAARLESATKQYGVAILMSADFAALLSPRMRARCRQIDTVLVKGSAHPMGIWTVDTDTRFIPADGRKVSAGSRAFVHSSRTDFAWQEADLDEFDGHLDVQLSYAADAPFLQAWQVRHLGPGAL